MKISHLLALTFVSVLLFNVKANDGIYYGDNFVVFEAEATSSPLKYWTLRKPGDPLYQKYFNKAPEVDAIFDSYLQYTGPWVGGDNPQETELEYTFTCPKTANYRLLMRMHQPLEAGEKGDAKNDVFVLLKGNFTSGINKPTSDLQKKHKFWGRGVNKWGSCHKVEIGSNMLLKYNLVEGEEYTFVLSGRSTKTCIDYILFYEDSAFGEIPQGADVATFFPENMRPGLGLVDPTKVSIVPDSARVRLASEIKLSLAWEPVNANTDVQWSSSNEQVLTVDQNGKVTAIGTLGQKAKIIVRSLINEVTDTCEVTIVEWFENPVKSVTVSPKSSQVIEGSSLTLKAMVYPENADNLNVTWSSSDVSVATVNQNGKVTALKEGLVTIRLTSHVSDTLFDEATIEVAKRVQPSVQYDDDNKYLNSEYVTGDTMKVTVEYNAGTFQTVKDPIKVFLRQMEPGWKVVKDISIDLPEYVGTNSGVFTAHIPLEGAIPTADLPTGHWYFLFVKCDYTGGGTANKGLNPITIVAKRETALADVSAASSSWLVYPNPVRGTLKVNAEALRKFSKMEVYSGTGQLIRTAHLNKEFTHLETHNFKPGLYLVLFSKGAMSKTVKVVVK